jgi:hypothetical protein
MSRKGIGLVRMAAAGLLCFGLFSGGGAPAQEAPKVKIPEPGVPQIMTMEGRYMRVAYNNEGYAILGYRVANMSIGQPWMLLEVGISLRDKMPDYVLRRDALSIETPDGKTIPLATVPEYREANLGALQHQAKVQRDNIDIFPPNAHQACRIGFFDDVNSRGNAWDQVTFTDQQACLGRLYFQVPGGIAYGQHWLNVKFANSLVRVPFRILTKEEYALLDKNYKSISKQVKDAFKPPPKKQ